MPPADGLRVYVAGPYSQGDTIKHLHAAVDMADDLLTDGHVPFVPHLSALWHLAFPRDYEEWLAWCLAWLPQCQAVLRLPGESSGADREVLRALELGIPVYASPNCLEKGEAIKTAREATDWIGPEVVSPWRFMETKRAAMGSGLAPEGGIVIGESSNSVTVRVVDEDAEPEHAEADRAGRKAIREILSDVLRRLACLERASLEAAGEHERLGARVDRIRCELMGENTTLRSEINRLGLGLEAIR